MSNVVSPFKNLRDLISSLAPDWMSEFDEAKSFGWRTLTTLALLVDGALEVVAQGSLAAVGKGTPTAFPYLEQARGLILNQNETDANYGKRLATWIDRAKENGDDLRLVLALHDYLRSHPRIRVFKRRRMWGDGFSDVITVDTDRTVTLIENEPDWDWDSVSNPERNDPDAPWWSDMWIVVYTTSGSETQWPLRGGTWGTLDNDGLGIGHDVTRREVDDIRRLIHQCKGGHSCVRAIIWTSDTNLFVPGVPSSMPDGTWGRWGTYDIDGDYIASNRNYTTCRYWEFCSDTGSDPLSDAVKARGVT